LPRRALTAASVERLKPPAKGQIEHFDQGFPGLALRLSYGGGKSWVYFYRLNGRQRRLTFGTYPALGLAEARKAWRDAKADVEAGRDPGATRKRDKPAHDFAAMAEEWLKRDQAKNRTAPEATRIIAKYVLPAWGSRRVDELGWRDVLDLVDSIADRGTPVMARRVHARLHRFFAWCVDRDIITSNPMAGHKKQGSETKRDRVLNDDELLAVWLGAEELGWPFGTAIRLLILTGARREEIGQLRWSETVGVPTAASMIRLAGARTKNDKPHDIPLSTPAVHLLEGAPHVGSSDFVFTTNGRTPVSGWSGAKSQMDVLVPVVGWRIHDLRRTTATGLQKLGTPLQVTEAVLGHTSGSRAGVVGIYQRHDYANEKRAALEAWGAHVMALVEGRKPGVVLPMRGRP
jgi:integrase